MSKEKGPVFADVQDNRPTTKGTSSVSQATEVSQTPELNSKPSENERPRIREEPGSITFTWPGLEVIVDAKRWTDAGQAELAFWHDNADHRLLLYQARVNLLSTANRQSLTKCLIERAVAEDIGFLPWDWMLTCITWQVLKTARQGEPVQEITPLGDDTLTPEYLLTPLLYLNHPAVIFGDYGSHKSLLAQAIGYIVQLPYHDNDLGLATWNETTKVLYADYESDDVSFRKRWTAIQRGFGIEPYMPILYRRMAAPIADDIEELRNIVAKENIGLLIADSLGLAAGGNLNDAEQAIRYNAALRQLGITSLTLAHNSKDMLTKKKSIFGSVFFSNLARSVWEIKAEQEVGERETTISLKQHKASYSQKHPTMGYRFTFADDKITIAQADLRDTGLSGELPLSWQVKNLLRPGSLPVNEIAEQLNSNPDTIGRTLRRMRSKEQVVKLEGSTWGLRS